MSRVLYIFFGLMFLSGLVMAQSFKPIHALELVTVDIDLLRALEENKRLLQDESLGLSAGLGLSPEIVLENDDLFDPESSFVLEPELKLSATISHQFDEAKILKRYIDVLEAEEALIKQQRSSVEAALLLQASLLRAQVSLRAKEASLAKAVEELEELRAEKAATFEVEKAVIALELASLGLRQSEQDLAELQEEARGLGFADHAEFEPLSFELKPVEPEALFEYKQFSAKLARLKILATRDSAFEIVDSLSLRTKYEYNALRAELELALDAGIPKTELSGDYLFASRKEDHAFSIGIGAEFRFDDKSIASFEQAQHDVAEAERDLARFVAEFLREQGLQEQVYKQQQAEFLLAQRLFELNTAQHAKLKVQQQTHTKNLKEIQGSIGVLDQSISDLEKQQQSEENTELTDQLATLKLQKLDLLERQEKSLKALEQTDKDLSKITKALDSSEDALYRSWISLVKDVADYLEFQGADWESVRPLKF